MQFMDDAGTIVPLRYVMWPTLCDRLAINPDIVFSLKSYFIIHSTFIAHGARGL